ncbi:MAG: hydantoinase B/oxoprolinase family protein [Bacillota bacterium]|nr:MAG: hydantoinase B/oxoprolinase family protein [Bacillota bacterium]
MKNPIHQKILWDRLISITNEQSAALIRTAFTPLLREAEDLSAGVFDGRARMVAQSETGTPGHINSMATGVKHFLREYPPERLDPGDVLITNDPWYTSGHLNDLTVATPVFHRGKAVGFFANTCHALDMSGRPLSADAHDVYEEGLYIPIMKLCRKGELNEDLVGIIKGNVREPAAVMGDLQAQIACNYVGATRLVSLLEEFALDDLEEVSDIITGRTEEVLRQAIAALPDGDYSSETWADGYDEAIRIRTRVTISGDELAVDFSGSSPESSRGINVVYNYTAAYTTFALKAAIAQDVPNNDGSFRPVRIIIPEGTILSARRPAPVAARAILGHFVPGAVLRALSPILGERAMALGADSVWLTTLQGKRPPASDFSYTFFVMGGTGARACKDGLSATGFPSGVAGCPVEVTENLTPILFHKKELRPGSGGAGRFRGGLGQSLELAVASGAPYRFGVTCDRTKHVALGLDGGAPGGAGTFALDTGEVLNDKTSRVLDRDRRVYLDLPGGGGYGDPLDRSPEAVLRDAILGYITPQEAAEVYGVAVRVSGSPDELVRLEEDYRLDLGETRRLRQQMRLGQQIRQSTEGGEKR